jgi:hypothetical protein
VVAAELKAIGAYLCSIDQVERPVGTAVHGQLLGIKRAGSGQLLRLLAEPVRGNGAKVPNLPVDAGLRKFGGAPPLSFRVERSLDTLTTSPLGNLYVPELRSFKTF